MEIHEQSRTIVAERENGEQVLITFWLRDKGEFVESADADVEVAWRKQIGDTWGPPMKIREDSIE